MIRIFSVIAGLLMFCCGSVAAQAEAAKSTPDFQEVYDVVRSHLAGMSEADLNRAAVQGLLSELGPRVSLVTSSEAAPAATGPLVLQSNLFSGDIAYLRIGRVGEGLDKALRAGCDQLKGTNSLKGVVLDLRYAGGSDYAAAAAASDLFLKKQRPLLNWGQGVVDSKAKDDAISVPVAVLVNGQTAAAAEALAGVLRETGAGLILGGRTAGRAMLAEEFPLKSGQRLRIATAPIQLGNGSALSAQGLKPDIAVDVSAEDERAYYADAFKAIPKTNLLAAASGSASGRSAATNRPPRRTRFNEAELVRERKEGVSLDGETANGRDAEPEEPTVHDPALARALDVLKGLAVVRQSRS